jgi:hypothetical protein
MIRTLAVAAAAAAVGYAIGQRAGDGEGSRFSKPEVTGGNVVVKDGEPAVADYKRHHIDSGVDNPYKDWDEFDEDGRIGR